MPLLPFVLAVVALAHAGCNIAIGNMAAGLQEEAAPHVPMIGEAIPTSFGSITVLGLKTLDGLSPEQLAGKTHGVQNLVTADQAGFQVAFLVANTSGQPVRLGPSQFSLTVAGSTEPRSWLSSTLEPRSLAPGLSLESSVMFAVPRAGQNVRVDYTAPGAAPITIASGRLDQGPAAIDGHME